MLNTDYTKNKFIPRTSRQIHRALYCFIIAVIVTLPLVLTVINSASIQLKGNKIFNEPELSGVANIPARSNVSLGALQSGQFQSDFEKFFEYNLATRKISTRVYNQLMYSIFNSTDSSSIIVGRDKYLFERAYPNAYLAQVSPHNASFLTEKINNLMELKRLLNERGVVLAIRISPTKAHHYPEYLPSAFDRYIKMKQSGEYEPNWYEVFMEEIGKVDIPVYDRYDLIQQMKKDGQIAFTKGGTHWTLAPMEEYINGFNEYLERILDKKLGRVVVTSEKTIYGEMGIPSDSDLWDTCWNALWAKPDYPSPHIKFDTIHGEFKPNVLNVGQSFSTILLNAIYISNADPVWNETLFSWYNGRVLLYPNPHGLPWGERISEQTDDYEYYLGMDVIVIEFLENTANPDATQFQFVNNMLQYLKKGGELS